MICLNAFYIHTKSIQVAKISHLQMDIFSHFDFQIIEEMASEGNISNREGAVYDAIDLKRLFFK